MPRRGEARRETCLINKNENAACLDSCSAIPLAARPWSRSRCLRVGSPRQHTPWATYTNTSWLGARTAARTGQRQRVHVNYLWKYATDCGLAEAACNLPWGILFHTNWNYRRKGREAEGGNPNPNLKPTQAPAPARHGLLVCVPFKVNLPVRLSVGWAVCAGILITTATTKTSTTAAPTCHTLQ